MSTGNSVARRSWPKFPGRRRSEVRKSWVAGLLCEELIHHRYSVCVIDPEGDYTGLDALPGVIRLGGTSAGPTPRDLRTALRYPDVNVVIDLHRCATLISGATSDRFSTASTRSTTPGDPHRIVIDEAHYLLHDPNALTHLDLELAGYTLVTTSPRSCTLTCFEPSKPLSSPV